MTTLPETLVEVVLSPGPVLHVETGIRGIQGPPGAPGEQGEPGIPGPPGDAEGFAYRHIQDEPLGVWLIDHNLGFYPAVTVVDSAGSEVVGDVQFLTINTVRIQFTAPFAGWVHLS